MKFKFVSQTIFTVFILYQVFCKAQPKYTDDEKNKIQKFRELVKDDLYMDYMNSDTYLIKWLQTKNFNQNDARIMLQKAMKWRKEHKVDTILQDDKIRELANKLYYTDGTDYNGSLVCSGFPSRVDVRKLIASGKKYSVGVRLWIFIWERALQNVMERVGAIGNNTRNGTTTDLVTVITDVDGYNLRQHACVSCSSMYLEYYTILENYYPGYIKHLIYINAPRIYIPLLEYVKPILSNQTKNALKVFGHNKEEWLEVIDKIVPANERRFEFGGTKSNEQTIAAVNR